MDTTRRNGNNIRKTHLKRRNVTLPPKHLQEGDTTRDQYVAKKGKACRIEPQWKRAQTENETPQPQQTWSITP